MWDGGRQRPGLAVADGRLGDDPAVEPGERHTATQIIWRQVQALVCSHRAQHEEAERLAREAVSLAEGTDALIWQGDALRDLAEVLQSAGRPQEAVAVLEQALERYQRMGNLPMAAQIRQRLGTAEDSVPLV